ncbi:glycosyltransferase family 2 protein [Aquabacterium parvum]|uniref:glycosyltransferase family 2 protein n=1 Tax=Aquabacterium parvum TaxID=70584 RepID=UPI000718E897|nr:glycosyltransferase family 2 protein [Aquabacterium parvum]
MADPKLKVLILGAGVTANSSDGDPFPAFMAEVKGAPLIQRIVESCAGLQPDWIGIACQSKEIDNYQIWELPRLLHPKASFLATNSITHGAACTALLASEHIDNEDELLILGVNEYIDADFTTIIQRFRDRRLDGGVLTFPSIHPRYSYVKTSADGLVQQAAEKRPISNTAAATFFWYRRGSDFVMAAKDVIRKNDHVNDLYYISPTINQMLLRQKRIGIEALENGQYHPFKTTRQIENFETVQEFRK